MDTLYKGSQNKKEIESEKTTSSLESQFEYEYLRFNSLKILKKTFLKNSGVDQNYEASKVWANWVIVNRIKAPQIDPFLPTEEIDLDNKTVSLLIEKGCREQDAIRFYAGFIQQCQRWKHRFGYYRIGAMDSLPFCSLPPGLEGVIPNTIEGGIKITPEYPKSLHQKMYSSTDQRGEQINSTYYTIEYRGIHHTLGYGQFCSLLRQYKGRYPYFDLWKMLNHYFLLDGLSYQWSLPPQTFEILRNDLGVRTELFASPLNHHLESYYSLFPDNDRYFGSLGDFFKSTWEDFRQGGIYEANPPFIESIFVQVSQILLHYIEKAAQEGVSLSFIFIMPDWLDSFGYQRLKSSRFLFKEIVLKKYNHSYWEYRKDKYITAHFDSHVLLITSDPKDFSLAWTDSVEKDFTETFASKSGV